MPVPVPELSSAAEKEVDNSGIQLLWGVGLLLLVFALVFLVISPNREKPAFSEMYWSEPPVFVSDANGLFLTFGVRVNSIERAPLNYHLAANVEGSLAVEKDFLLNPGQGETFPFRIPMKEISQSKNELRIILTRTSVGDENKSFATLEILDWFAGADENAN